MIDEIFNVMKFFSESYINRCGELIISDRGNVYFTATNCTTKEDVICKLLEWCSRPIAKGTPYSTNKRNNEWRNSLLCGYNNYLGTNFTQEDMYKCKAKGASVVSKRLYHEGATTENHEVLTNDAIMRYHEKAIEAWNRRVGEKE